MESEPEGGPWWSRVPLFASSNVKIWLSGHPLWSFFPNNVPKWYHKLYVLLRSLVRFLFVWLFDYLLAWMSGMMVTEISNAVKMMSLTRSQIMEISWRFNFMQKITGIGKHSLLSICFFNDFRLNIVGVVGARRRSWHTIASYSVWGPGLLQSNFYQFLPGRKFVRVNWCWMLFGPRAARI